MASDRQERRKERRRLLRQLGYSPAEADRLRDWSGQRIETNISTVERRLARVPVEDRSENVQQRLRAIRDHKRQRRIDPAKTRGRLESRSERIRNFSEWSRIKQFPPDVQAKIIEINKRARKRPFAFNSYGYRIYYHMYINRETEPTARRRHDMKDRRDT